jgi:acetyl-CoA C-acetyltransferase
VNRVFMVAGRRTSISPKWGALANAPFHELAAMAAQAVMADANVAAEQIDGVFLGNALAAGGNPARLAALASSLPCQVPAWSIDTQCCSGLDAISLAVDRIRAGNAHVLLAGGAESASQAPQRSKRAHAAKSEQPSEHELGGVGAASATAVPGDFSWVPYDEADFTPWPKKEPSMVQAARALSAQLRNLDAEYAWAVRSHERARTSVHPERIGARTAIKSETRGGSEDIQDTYTRVLTPQACQRAASHPIHNPTTMATLADGAAMVLLMSEQALKEWLEAGERDGVSSTSNLDSGLAVKHKAASAIRRSLAVCEVISCCQVGADPFAPGLSTAALKNWLDRLRADHGEPACVEIMESFAAQTILNIKALALDSGRVNVGGGLLAMGHPIGASGAVLVARLHHRLRPGEWGAALIPAAGGLASGIALGG